MNLLLHLACLFTLLTAAASPPAVPVDGEPFAAELTGINAAWQLTFGVDGKPRNLPAADLVSWGSCAEPARRPILIFAGGGLLLADVFRADGETLTADSELFGVVKLPRTTLAGVVFHPPPANQGRDRLLDRVRRARGTSDRVVLHNGDEITGLVEAIEDNTVTLKADVGPLQIEIDRVAALIFNPNLKQSTQPPGLRAWAGLADGSRLIATQLALDDTLLTLSTAGGQTYKTSPKELVALQPIGGRVTYLSDLKAAGYRHVPFLDLTWPYHTDRNVTGGRLRSGGRLYLKGLGMHSAARLTYGLDKPYTRFQAELAIDDSTRGGGSVRFRVFVDGRQKFASQTIRGGMAPVPVSVDLTGGKRLDLIVDYAEQADQLDHANWLGARLIK